MSIKGQGGSLTLAKGHSDFTILTFFFFFFFSQKLLGHLNQSSYESLCGTDMS